MNKNLRQRADTLKQYEIYGYQIAYYLLENEDLAIQASVQALMELSKDEEIFRQPRPLQIQKAKQIFIKQSLLTKKRDFQDQVHPRGGRRNDGDLHHNNG